MTEFLKGIFGGRTLTETLETGGTVQFYWENQATMGNPGLPAVVTSLWALTRVLGLEWGTDYADREVVVVLNGRAVELQALTQCFIDAEVLVPTVRETVAVVPPATAASTNCNLGAVSFTDDGAGSWRGVEFSVKRVTYNFYVAQPLSIHPRRLLELYDALEREVTAALTVRELEDTKDTEDK